MIKTIRATIAALTAGLILITMTGCGGGGSGSGGSSREVEPGTIGEFPAKVLECQQLAETLDPDNEKVILFWYDGAVSDYSIYTAYNWISAGDETKMVDFVSDTTTKIGYADFTDFFDSLTDEMQAAITAGDDFNFIIRKVESWTKKTGDEVFPLSNGKHAMYIGGDIYTISDNMTATISSANMETTTNMKVVLGVKYGLETFASDNGFTLTAEDGTTNTIIDIVNYSAKDDRSKNNAQMLYVTLASPIDTSKIWTLSHADFGSKIVATAAAVADSLKDVKYDGDDLGLTLSGSTATFKVWAPSASDVKVLLYASVTDVGTYNASSVALNVPGALTDTELLGSPLSSGGIVSMTKDASTGVWTADSVDVSGAKYYKYQNTVAGKVYYVCDIYAKAASPDSIAAQITDINSDQSAIPSGWESSYTNPFTGTTYNEAVIYEMHIRDWSRATVADSTGKFLDFASDQVIQHLVDLGVTHVQILPCFDYAQVNSDLNYNWGYNPYHYNVPEGRYVDYSSNQDGTAAVSQMRQMVAKLHNAGIAVIMDVVYNHTSGTGAGSLYDSTVPYYYYRVNADGSYSNGSGCGNETNSEAPMFKKYMIETLKHWMNDYHINGFRFDLMGLHSKDTMEAIGAALKEIDPSVLVYGEPWTGGTSLVSNTANAAGNNYGAFDDDFRDAVKGAEFGGFNAGQVQGIYNDSGITNGLKGKSGKNNRNTTSYTGHALHYVECHDNFTLYDKLVYSLGADTYTATDKTSNYALAKEADSKGNIATVFPASVSEEELALIKKQEKLAAAFVILSQGTPFLNGGQDFMRTKKGNPDSYSADKKGGITWTSRYATGGSYVPATDIDDVNSIDLGFKATYSDVYNTYKALIALRKSSTAFTAPTKIVPTKITNGVTYYELTDGTDTYYVFYNTTFGDEDYILPAKFQKTGHLVTLSETDGSITVSSEETTVTSIPANSFIILKQ